MRMTLSSAENLLPIYIYSYSPACFESKAMFAATVYSSSQEVTPRKGSGAAQWGREPTAAGVGQTGLQRGTSSAWVSIPDAIQNLFPLFKIRPAMASL